MLNRIFEFVFNCLYVISHLYFLYRISEFFVTKFGYTIARFITQVYLHYTAPSKTSPVIFRYKKEIGTDSYYLYRYRNVEFITINRVYDPLIDDVNSIGELKRRINAVWVNTGVRDVDITQDFRLFALYFDDEYEGILELIVQYCNKDYVGATLVVCRNDDDLTDYVCKLNGGPYGSLKSITQSTEVQSLLPEVPPGYTEVH